MSKTINRNIINCKKIILKQKKNKQQKRKRKHCIKQIKKMNFINHIEKRTHKMILNNHLIIIELIGHEMIEFIVYRQNEQNMLWKASVREDKMCVVGQDEEGMGLGEVFEVMKRRPQECIEQSRDGIQLRIQLKNNKKSHQPPTSQLSINLPLISQALAIHETLHYTKQLFVTRQQQYKSQVLRLKSNIYQLMTQLQDATMLIKSQSSQARHHREQVKQLKREVDRYRTEKSINNVQNIKKNKCQQIGVQSCLIIQGQSRGIHKSSINDHNKQSLEKLNRHQLLLTNNNKSLLSLSQKKMVKPISGMLVEQVNNDSQQPIGQLKYKSKSNKKVLLDSCRSNSKILQVNQSQIHMTDSNIMRNSESIIMVENIDQNVRDV